MRRKVFQKRGQEVVNIKYCGEEGEKGGTYEEFVLDIFISREDS